MHGIVYGGLRRFFLATFDAQAWDQAMTAAGLPGHTFDSTKHYTDAPLGPLLKVACERSGLEPMAIQEAFGEFLGPDLMRLYRNLIDPRWRTLDLIENTEKIIHAAVRKRQPGADPPILRISRPSPHEVVVKYSSPRRLCGMAKGIARALAYEFAEQVVVAEPHCQIRGDPECELRIRKA
jgi:hypothetical protein